MDETQQAEQGFTPHVMDQLAQMAAEPSSRSRGRGRGGRGRSRYQRFDLDQQPSHARQSTSSSNATLSTASQATANSSSSHTSNSMSFSSLKSANPVVQANHVQVPQHIPQRSMDREPTQQYQQTWHSHTPGEFAAWSRPSGRYGGRARGQHNFHARSEDQSYLGNSTQHQNSQPAHGRHPNHGGNPYFGTADQQRAFRHRIMSQSDFLGTLANRALQNQISQEEFRAKEVFRKIIQDIAQREIIAQSVTAINFDVGNVKLKLYGSLGSGFGVAGSDMDLLLTFPQADDMPEGIETDARRWLEKGLLDAGFGARLLTNTRVPILKVCEKPSPNLLSGLRATRRQWEDAVKHDADDVASAIPAAPLPPQQLPDFTIVQTLQDISIEAAETPLPDSTVPDQTKVEFVGDCGIQCDINFTNYVALRNTELLRTYGQCDARVRQVGLFVKYWAKARDINTPYKGTLSSYGYIMMVLHYLMNIVSPPLIPNLQMIARDQDAWEKKTEIETVEGFDVRFIRHPEQLQQIMANMKPNHESLGSLLRGFFWYYACNGGFHWTRDAISIRSRGGQVSKHSKGWTGAKWSESKQNVRLRYLLAIEDPFETEHNIGRTVGHSGIVAIRDEFRRAWSIIENVHLDELQRVWVWNNKETGELRGAEELIDSIDNRGDLLRRDQLAHKDKMRQLRKEAEDKEQALHALQAAGNSKQQESGIVTGAGNQ